VRTAPGTSFLHRWLAAVYASKLTTAERDTLCAYSSFMSPQGYVRIRQRVISGITGRPERHIRTHLAAARSAGLMDLIVAGNVSRVSVYQATIPAWAPDPRERS